MGKLTVQEPNNNRHGTILGRAWFGLELITAQGCLLKLGLASRHVSK